MNRRTGDSRLFPETDIVYRHIFDGLALSLSGRAGRPVRAQHLVYSVLHGGQIVTDDGPDLLQIDGYNLRNRR